MREKKKNWATWCSRVFDGLVRTSAILGKERVIRVKQKEKSKGVGKSGGLQGRGHKGSARSASQRIDPFQKSIIA